MEPVFCAALIGGNPAVAFSTVSGATCTVKFLRATDASGTAWPAASTAQTLSGSVADSGNSLSLAEISGTPGIAMRYAATGKLTYTRSSVAAGTSGWSTAVDLDNTIGTGYGNGQRGVELIAGSKPVVLYEAIDGALESDLHSVAANDSTGAAWAAPTVVLTEGNVGQYPVAAVTEVGGFAGQLYELANSITLAAASPTVGEGGSVALSARRVLSDGTLLAIPSTSLAWSVQSGPLPSITASGLALAGAVYEDTPAVAQGIYLGMSATVGLTVLDQDPDNYGTYAGDGLPDFWQFTHFGLNNAIAAPTVDADGDGENNRLEYLATTTPTNPASRLTLRIESVPAHADWRRIVFEPYGNKRTYTLHASEDLANPLAWQQLSPVDEGIDGVSYYFIDDKAVELAKFYHIEISE